MNESVMQITNHPIEWFVGLIGAVVGVLLLIVGVCLMPKPWNDDAHKLPKSRKLGIAFMLIGGFAVFGGLCVMGFLS